MKEVNRDKSKKIWVSQIKMDEFANALSIFAICERSLNSDTEDRSIKC